VGWRAGLAVEKAALFEESQRARQDLERANQTKDEFLGLVSHELRTPITTIYGSARLLMRTPSRLDDATKEELIGAIGEEADKMVQLVESLLMLARLEVGQALQKVPVSIAEAIERCAEPLVSAGRKVEIDYENRVKEIDADRTYLQHILTNLLSNADKYSPPDAPIGLVVQENDSAVEFHVLDQGLGVEVGELDMIFDSFYRSPRTAQLPGKGLGLAICKRLTEAQGGRIWANLRPGGGMEVAFSLPK
jgi:K+-sensing histidine kinase KdpD